MSRLITFDNARSVIKAEEMLKKSQVKTKVVPSPLHLSSTCGMSLVVEDCDIEQIEQIMQSSNINITIYEQ